MKKELDIDFRKCVDDLGRVVIPKELRNRFNIKDGDNLKINYCEDTITIEKIKPKTLVEQLKEQGFGWELDSYGDVEETCFDEEEFENDSTLLQIINQGNVFLTKSEAEREAYRRKLEFEMQEWARENDCLSTVSAHLDCQIFKMFNVYVRTIEKCNEAKTIFNGKAGKYYNWGD